MPDRISTLLLYASGVPRWKRFAVDTTLAALHVRSARIPQSWRRGPVQRLLDGGYAATSYTVDWREAFLRSPRLAVDACNINDLLAFSRALGRITSYELIIVLHCATGDDLSHIERSVTALQRRKGALVVFIGNEYNLMPRKIGFARATEPEIIASQLPIAAAEWLYTACVKSRIVSAPHALNPAAYRPLKLPRTTDIGFRGDLYAFSYSLGDEERTRIVRYFQEHAPELGLTADIEFSRYPRQQWCEFLNRCRATVGAESGTYYLERSDSTQNAVIAYLKANPNATFVEVFDRFFRNYQHPVSGKSISSRHFEAIGTQTCQVLVEGEFNGVLDADVHYIAVRKDFSNLQAVVDRLLDEPYRRRMTLRTYEFAMEQHTYDHRVASILRALDESTPMRQVTDGYRSAADR